MEFTFVTDHDRKSFTALARVLRKTTRRASSITSSVIGGVFIAMMLPAILVMLMSMSADGKTVTVDALLKGLPCMVIFLSVVVVPVFFDDLLTGFLARKQMQPGTERSTAVFSLDGYTITTSVAKTEFQYDNILYISETTDYFVFVMGRNHGVIFSKSSISGGTPEDFRRFIEERTNKKLLKIKG